LSTNDFQHTGFDNTNRSLPVSIQRNDYLRNIKQGALSTFDLGCNLLGFGSSTNKATEEEKIDEHHLSFTEEHGLVTVST